MKISSQYVHYIEWILTPTWFYCIECYIDITQQYSLHFRYTICVCQQFFTLGVLVVLLGEHLERGKSISGQRLINSVR